MPVIEELSLGYTKRTVIAVLQSSWKRNDYFLLHISILISDLTRVLQEILDKLATRAILQLQRKFT